MANSRIEALRRKQQSIKSAIEAEVILEQRRKDRDATRLHLILGAALVRDSEDSPEFKSMLVRVLEGANLGASERAFLARKGWL